MRKGTHTLLARSQNISREELKPLRMTKKKYKLPTQQQSNDEIVSENINNRKLSLILSEEKSRDFFH